MRLPCGALPLLLLVALRPVSPFVLRHHFFGQDLRRNVRDDGSIEGPVGTTAADINSGLQSGVPSLLAGTVASMSDGLSYVYDLFASVLDSGLRFAGLRRHRTGIHGWLVEREAGQPAFFQMHIPKTAGSSFTLDVANGYMLPPGVGFFSQEWCFHSAWDMNFALDKFVTFLRRPMDHVYSMYFECVYTQWGRNNFHPPDGEASNFSAWVRHFSKENPNHTAASDAYGCYDPRNMQTRAFTCTGRESTVHHEGPNGVRLNAVTTATKAGRARLNVALQRMEDSFVFVGIVERYHESWCLFFAKVNGFMPAGCDCSNQREWDKSTRALRHVDFLVPRHNATADLSPEDREVISDMTAQDQRLYDAAVKRFEAEAKEAEATYNVRLLC